METPEVRADLWQKTFEDCRGKAEKVEGILGGH